MTSEFGLYLVKQGTEYFEHDGTPTTYYAASRRTGINHFKKVADADFIVQVNTSGVMGHAKEVGYDEYLGKEIAYWGGVGNCGGPKCVVEAIHLQPYALKWATGSEVKATDYFSVAKDTDIEVLAPSTYDPMVASKAARKHNGCITTNEGLCVEWRYDAGADGKGPGFYFIWGDGKRVRFENATKGETPAPKADKVKVPTIRDYLIPNSKWTITGDINVNAYRRLPNYQFESYLFTTLHAGDEITVTGKFKRGLFENSLNVPVKIPGGTTHMIAYDELKEVVEQIGEVDMIPEYFIYDRLHQKYYSGSEYHYDNHNKRNDILIYVDKLSKARKFKRLGDVRAHALVQSGYYDGLPGEHNLPDWMRGGKAFDIPETWEIHEINKLTKLLNKKIELTETFDRTWRLRGLTMKYGSAVRAVYSDLDKKDKLNEYSAVLVFAKRESNNKYYDDFELSDAEKADIAEAISNVDKKELKSSKSYGAHAFAIKDSSTGVMIRLTYSGDLECKVIDLQLMAEVVGEDLGASEISEQIKES
jgi:hypothetical protein